MGQGLTEDKLIDWDSLSDEEVDVLERKIAGQYMHIVPWGAVAWAFLNLAVWLGLWPLVFFDVLPLWVAFPIASINVAICYLPSHEAQHSIIARKGRPLRWLNELVGHVSTIPLVVPFRVLRATHFEHHTHTNDPILDPDYNVHAESGWEFLKKSVSEILQPAAASSAYPDTLKRLAKEDYLVDALIFRFVYLLVLFVCAWTGHAIEAALLWWLPLHIGNTYIRYYLSWAPHNPGLATGRYRDTRAFKSYVGNIISLGMQYHIVHHLYPRIPLSLNPAAFRELRPILVRRECELGGM